MTVYQLFRRCAPACARKIRKVPPAGSADALAAGQSAAFLCSRCFRLDFCEKVVYTDSVFFFFMPVCRNWQTRQTQNLLSARVCGFESHHRHQINIIRTYFQSVMGSDYLLYLKINSRMANLRPLFSEKNSVLEE